MSLSTFSNSELTKSLNALIQKETLTTVEILDHLNEVERRDLHLKLGFSSLWDYAVRGLKYSEPAAQRRISSARALFKHPELRMLLLKRLVNLTTVSLVASALSPDSKTDILKSISGKTKREVEEFIGTYRPVTKIVEKVTPVKVQPKLPSPAQLLSPTVTDRRLSPIPVITSSPKPLPERATFSKSSPAPAVQMFKVQCALSEQGFRKLKEVESLLSHTTTSLGEVIERLCDYYLKKESPMRTAPKRAVRPAAALGEDGPNLQKPTRYIPRAIKQAVWKRDGGRCTFKGPDGRSCGSTHRLEIDHIKPFALGGESTVDNLRMTCAAHNRHLGRQAFPGKGR